MRVSPTRVLASLAVLLPCAMPAAAQKTPSLTSSHAGLENGFAWAVEQSLAYAFDRGDPVGPWYEAALPGREAFCMRDVSHQLTGGLALGLWAHTRNMLGKFAASIAPSRQWAGYWEIDRLDRPAPVDYRSDDDFWYNLPANFDVVDAAVRAYEWTGDISYLDDPALLNFHRRSLTDYVAAWDPDGDGLQESGAENGYRGIPTYWEGDGARALTGGDLIAAQYAANTAAGHAFSHIGRDDEAARFLAEAVRLKRLYNDGWWNEELGRFATAEVADGTLDTKLIPLLQILPVYYGIVEPGPRLERLMDAFPEGDLVEVNVYRAEAFYATERNEAAFQALLRQMDPDLARREYPENPFTAVGTTIRYLAGLNPRASERVIETLPRLPGSVSWVEVAHVPTFAGEVGVRQDGNRRARLTNEGRTPIQWRAAFPGEHATLLVDGRPIAATMRRSSMGSAESFVSVGVPAGTSVTVAVPRRETFEISGIDVELTGELNGFEVTVTRFSGEDGVDVARIRLRRATPAAPPRLSLRWSLPSTDIQGQWSPASGMDKTINPDWAPSQVRSALARHAPVMALFGSGDENRLTFAVSDGLNAATLQAAVREEDARIHAGIDLFTERHRDVDEITVDVRFDVRPRPLSRALSEVSAWWAAQPGYAPAPVPEVGRLPMYSTWYSYHQDVTPEKLLPEVEAAAALGYEAIIVDDGWQTLDSRRGYAFTGDWKPERIPGMKDFVDAVHERGMSFILWYAVPLVGERSQAFDRFQGKFLRYWNGQGAYELDPRYPEVRTHIIDTYRTAIQEWGVDGFKLDFLGRFVANDATMLEATEGRDYASVNEATDRLMSDILSELRAVKPDVLIEFRQPYIGPKMRSYGNLFRAGDAPNSLVANRVRVVDLRMLSGNTAVHSDMLMWNLEESTEDAALQLLNIIFSVPQLSVRLAELPREHLAMVTHYTAWWRANRDVLLDGVFQPHGALTNYPWVMARNDRKAIAAVYEAVAVSLTEPLESMDILNGTTGTRVVVDAPEALGRYGYRVLDVTGSERSAGTFTLDGPRAFDVPPGGMVALTRMSPR